MRSVLTILAGFIALLGVVGCSSMTPGKMSSIQPVTTNERVGSVFLLRGWIGVFSTGIDKLGVEMNKQGVHAEVFQESQTIALANAIAERYRNMPQHEPIVLIGHSYGADRVVEIARRLQKSGVVVDLIITLDPVTPGKVPSNVKLAYNLYQSNGTFDSLPWLRGIPLTADEPGPRMLKNMNIRIDRPELLEPGLDHFNIEKKKKIHDDVIAQVLQVCQMRDTWTRTHQPTNVIAISSTETPQKQAR
ncbi:MAG TPA: hypothetical protein PK402_13810 [Tepidisphaeraceae bacterium]|nr:hypothetical protein [Tepidisphaeraceae bacterium]